MKAANLSADSVDFSKWLTSHGLNDVVDKLVGSTTLQAILCLDNSYLRYDLHVYIYIYIYFTSKFMTQNDIKSM